MRKRIPEWACVWAMLSVALLSGGCGSDLGRLWAYYLFGGNQRSVEAEFEGLEDKKVAVVIYTDQRTQYEFPDLNLTLSSAISGRIEDNVDGVEIIPPTKIARFQDENIYWDEMDKTELGKALGADYIVFVPLEEFSTRLPDSAYLYRGRVTCQPTVHDVSKPLRQSRVHEFEKIRVVYPEHEPAGLATDNDRQIRAKTEQIFADRVAWKFYDHDEEIKP